jgi:hypothetical protein
MGWNDPVAEMEIEQKSGGTSASGQLNLERTSRTTKANSCITSHSVWLDSSDLEGSVAAL